MPGPRLFAPGAGAAPPPATGPPTRAFSSADSDIRRSRTARGWRRCVPAAGSRCLAIAPAEAALRQSSSGISVRPFAYQALCALAPRTPPAPRACPRCRLARPGCAGAAERALLERPVLQRAAEALEVLGRQVDPPAEVVLADVAQDVRELERDAERVRERGGGGDVGQCRTHPATAQADRAPPRTGSSAAGRRRCGRSCPRTSASQPSMSSPNAASGMSNLCRRVRQRHQHQVAAGRRHRAARRSRRRLRAASAAAGDVLRRARSRWPGHPASAASFAGVGRSPSPMSSIRRAKA